MSPRDACTPRAQRPWPAWPADLLSAGPAPDARPPHSPALPACSGPAPAARSPSVPGAGRAGVSMGLRSHLTPELGGGHMTCQLTWQGGRSARVPLGKGRGQHQPGRHASPLSRRKDDTPPPSPGRLSVPQRLGCRERVSLQGWLCRSPPGPTRWRCRRLWGRPPHPGPPAAPALGRPSRSDPR